MVKVSYSRVINLARRKVDSAGSRPRAYDLGMTTERTDNEWRELLTPAEYYVLREAGTEPAFVGEYTDTETVGVYKCKACDAELFRSNEKFHSGCGWPSFYQPGSSTAVVEIVDNTHGMVRTEVRCANCDSHLGHVFSGEGYETPTDLRYCINSVALSLVPIS